MKIVQQFLLAFKNFYPYYLSQHQNESNRKIHFLGTTLLLCNIFLAIFIHFAFLIIGILIAYFFAHIGHAQFEKNESLRKTHPLFCVLGAGKMYWDAWKKILS